MEEIGDDVNAPTDTVPLEIAAAAALVVPEDGVNAPLKEIDPSSILKMVT